MKLNTAIVINQDTNAFVEFVVIKNNEPLEYVLGSNEKLEFNVPPPRIKDHAEHNGLLKPTLQDGVWVESASEEELAAWCAEHPKQERPLHPKVVDERRKTDVELAIIQQGQQITTLELNDIANGQMLTALELSILEGKTNV